MALELRALTLADEAAFLAGARAWDGEDLTWYSFSWQPGDDYAAHVRRLANNVAGVDLPDGHVAGSMLYGFVDGQIVGRVSIRHELNAFLRQRGGHIGYSVAPAYRRRGYATAMLVQALEYCRGLGLTRLLITCSDDNAASIRMIERAGGVLEYTVVDADRGAAVRRYWLALT
jgi:predicted acetyltransferase